MNSLDKSQFQKELQKKKDEARQPGEFLWKTKCRCIWERIGSGLCAVIILLFLCMHLPSLLPCFAPFSFPFLSLSFFPTRRVHDTLRSCICDKRSCFPSISGLCMFRRVQTFILLTQLFPFWGMGDLTEWLLLLLMGFAQLKSCASQTFSKETFFRSIGRPG